MMMMMMNDMHKKFGNENLISFFNLGIQMQ
jgi:hypothetical protein